MSARDYYFERWDCRICGVTLPEKRLIDFGETPLANEFRDAPTAPEDVERFPLYLQQCEGCGHVQLPVVVDPLRLFSSYCYVSGTSPVFVEHFRGFYDAHIPFVRKDDLVMPDLQPLPKGLEPWERWVDVSLEKQMLVAYEGTRPVYVTLVSTGKKGSEEEPFDTPTGRWRIYSKHISTTMDGNTASDGSYSIQDVPWTMFFYGSYALHGAFWHRSFGRVRSHGCVNLGPSDARWLFFWTTPFLPDGWHGVHATDESPGTTVIVRE